MNLSVLREEVERLSYLSDVYEDLKVRAAECTRAEAATYKNQLELAKKEIISLSYRINKQLERLTEEE
jgi:hypothetical protein